MKRRNFLAALLAVPVVGVAAPVLAKLPIEAPRVAKRPIAKSPLLAAPYGDGEIRAYSLDDPLPLFGPYDTVPYPRSAILRKLS